MFCSILIVAACCQAGAQDLFLPSLRLRGAASNSNGDAARLSDTDFRSHTRRPYDAGSVLTISPKSKPNLCLDYSQGHGLILLQMWECNGHENQLFYFDSGSYKITLPWDTSQCVDANWPLNPGNALITAPCKGYEQQTWSYDANMETIFLRDSVEDATYCMDLSGGKIEAGTVVEIWNCNGLPQQQFGLSHGITLRPFADYKLCLDIAGGVVKKGTAIQLWECNGLAQQKWKFENFQIASMVDDTKCIDAGDMHKGIYLQLWDCNKLKQQQWGYDPNMNTIYLSASSGLVDEDVPPGEDMVLKNTSAFVKTAVDMGDSVAVGASRPLASLCVDIYAGKLTKGTRLDLWQCNRCWNQQFQVIGPPSKLSVADWNSVTSMQAHGRLFVEDGCPPRPAPSPTPPGPPAPPHPPPPAPPAPHPPAPPPPPPPVPVPPQPPSGRAPHCGGAGFPNFPKFDNAKQLMASPWGKYFLLVYGTIPATGYPICTDGLQFLYAPLLAQAGVPKPNSPTSGCPVGHNGQLFTDQRWFQMSFAMWIYNADLEHPYPHMGGLPANTWVEVIHNAFSMDGAATWFYYAPGTAIYMNTGHTRLYKDHDAATNDLTNQKCKDATDKPPECVANFPAMYAGAKSQGLQSFQFWNHGDMQCGPAGKALLALEIIDLGGPGTTTCSQSSSGNTRFKSGWSASQPCDCDNSQKTINCKGFGMRTAIR